METPKVSVILPTYNQVQWIRNCLESVIEQKFSGDGFEIVIVNDGSTDGTKDIMDAIKEVDDEAVKVIELSVNTGVPNALNIGFTESNGKYLTWVSSDCWCEPNFLEVLVKALDEAPPEVGMVYSDFNIIDEEGNFIKRFCWPNMTYPRLLFRNLGNSSFLYRRECMDKIGLYDTNLFGCEDWDYWVRMGEHFMFRHICEPLYNYRWHSKSLQSTKRDMIEESKRKLFLKNYRRLFEE